MSVVEIIKHYQRSIDKCSGNEDRILHCITKLYHLPITVQHLQETGIGRTVNSLRKYDGECGEAAKACVAKWKAIVAAEESSDAESEEQQPVKEPEPLNDIKHKDHTNKKSKDSHDVSSKKLKVDDKQNVKVENGAISSYSDENNYVNANHKERDSSAQRNNVPVDNVDVKKHRSDKCDSNVSHSSSKKSKVSAETVSKHKENKQASPKSTSSSLTKSISESKASKSHGISESKASKSHVSSSSSKKHRDQSERSGHLSSKCSSESKQSSLNMHKESEERSSTKKHKEESKKSSSKKSYPDSQEMKSRKTEQSSDRKSVKRSRPMELEVSGDSSGDSEDFVKPNKFKNIKPSCSPPCSPFNSSPTGDGSIDCLSGASFAEALGMISPSPSKTRKTAKKPTSSPMEFDFLSTNSPDLKLEPSDIELPEINPNYRPQPNSYNPFDSPPNKKCTLTEDVVLEHLMSKNSSKTQRMKVFSGVKSGGSWKTVPTLFDICVRVLQENIDALEYTGGIPYDILKPVLKHASPDQLFMLEHYNPYLLEDTDPLWAYHVNRHFKNKSRMETETSREMYLRCLDEREEKLKSLKQSIKESQAKSIPVRQTKLAYVDSNYVKPPRNVARQQAKNGLSPRVAPKVVMPSTPSRPAPATVKQKPRMAPLMQKTMKFAKTFKR